jgi:hypothetical protein
VASLWRGFFARFLRVPTADPRSRPTMSLVPFGEGIPAIGDMVKCRYGRGIVASVRWGNYGVLPEDDDAPTRAEAAMNSSDTPPPVMVRIRLVSASEEAYVTVESSKVAILSSPEQYRVSLGLSGGMGSGTGSILEGGGLATGSTTIPAPGGRVRPLTSELPPPPAGETAPAELAGVEVAALAKRAGRKFPKRAFGAKGDVNVELPEVEGEDDGAALELPASESAERLPGDVNGLPPPPGSVYFGTAADFVCMRLHQMIAERLTLAKRLALRPTKVVAHVADRAAEPASSSSKNEGLDETTSPEEAKRRYTDFLAALHSVLAGSMDTSAYEDECRSLLGSGAYCVFTLDRIAQHAARQLQVIATDEASIAARSVYQRHVIRLGMLAARLGLTGAEPSAEQLRLMALEAAEAYRLDVASLLTHLNEDWYMIQYTLDTPTTTLLAERAENAKRRARAEKLGFDPETNTPLPSVAANGALGVNPVAALPEHSTGPLSPSEGASLSIRFVGVLNDQLPPGRVAAELPAFASRLIGRTIIMRGSLPSETAESNAKEDTAQRIAEHSVQPPFLNRNVKQGSPPPSTSSSGAVPLAVTGSHGVAAVTGGTETMVVSSSASSSSSSSAAAAAVTTAEESDPSSTALRQWTDQRVQSMPEPPPSST